MIKKINIQNMKSAKNIAMECSALNVLIGTNSSGKSSILQGLLFVGQNFGNAVGLNGRFLSMGTLEENRCVYSSEKNIRAGFEDSKGHMVQMMLFKEGDVLKLRRDYKPSETADIMSEDYDVVQRKIQYLSCHRLGAKEVYEKNMALEDAIGINGEYAIDYLNKKGPDPIEDRLCKGNIDFTLLGQVNWWLHYIAGVQISTEDVPGTNLVRASYSMYDIPEIKPENIGSGISYLVSMVIMCLSAPEDSLLVIENPEIHLHPSAQSKVCEFLYFIAETGRQIFVETHSDHIFNGFRAGIATGEMDRETVNIQFVSLNEEHVTEAMRVQIGSMGKVENQRKDLFDQFDLDLNKMLGLRMRKSGVHTE